MLYSTVVQLLASIFSTVIVPFLVSLGAILLGIKLTRRKVLSEKLAEGAVLKFFEYADTRARLRQGLDEWIGGPLVRGSSNAQTDVINALRDLRRISRQVAMAAPQFGQAAIDQVAALEKLISRVDAGEVVVAAHMLSEADKEYAILEQSIGKLTRV